MNKICLPNKIYYFSQSYDGRYHVQLCSLIFYLIFFWEIVLLWSYGVKHLGYVAFITVSLTIVMVNSQKVLNGAMPNFVLIINDYILINQVLVAVEFVNFCIDIVLV